MTAENDQTGRRRERAEWAGAGPEPSLTSTRRTQGGWRGGLPCALPCAPAQMPELRAAPPSRAPGLCAASGRPWLSCPPIKGFAGLTILGNSGRIERRRQRGGGGGLLKGCECHRSTACWAPSGGRDSWENWGPQNPEETQCRRGAGTHSHQATRRAAFPMAAHRPQPAGGTGMTEGLALWDPGCLSAFALE